MSILLRSRKAASSLGLSGVIENHLVHAAFQPRFTDQLLDTVSIGLRWLERPDAAGVVANALWKGARESRYELRGSATASERLAILGKR